MRATFQNIRNVRILQELDNGPVYGCTLDLALFNTDPITGEEHLSPDSGEVYYVANPNDVFGLGPEVYKAIVNGEYIGEIDK